LLSITKYKNTILIFFYQLALTIIKYIFSIKEIIPIRNITFAKINNKYVNRKIYFEGTKISTDSIFGFNNHAKKFHES
jgi:hypothetical protein